MLQNFIAVIIVVALGLFGVVSTEKLTWKLIRIWFPVNIIFVGMLVTGMYRYDTRLIYPGRVLFI